MERQWMSSQSLGRVLGAVRDIARNFLRDNCLPHAGNLAYISILSLVPLIVVGVSLFSVYGISAEMKEAILNAFLRHMLPQTAESAYRYIDSFISNARVLGLPGMVVLLFLSYSLYNAVQAAFQTIWRVRKRRTLVQNILVFTNVLFWTPLLMGVSIYLKMKLEFAYQASGLMEYGMSALAFLLPWAGFTAAYLIIPAVPVRFRSAALGGFFAALFWLFLLHGFDIYVKYTQSMQTLSKLYGSLVILPIFLVWVYFCWGVTFVGAEIASYAQNPGSGNTRGEPGGFFTALAIARFVAAAFDQGTGGVPEEEILRRWPGGGVILEKLIDLGILVNADRQYLLARPPEKVPVGDLFRKFTPKDEIGRVYQTIANELAGKTLRDCLD